jgi:hypothetical protein
MKFSKALELLEQGKNVRLLHWTPGFYIVKNDRFITFCEVNEWRPKTSDFFEDNWEEYFKIKVCPFCGKQPKYLFDCGARVSIHTILCNSILCKVCPEIRDITKEGVVKTWNTRY